MSAPSESDELTGPAGLAGRATAAGSGRRWSLAEAAAVPMTTPATSEAPSAVPTSVAAETGEVRRRR
jgi:hypothetical protein